MKTLKQVFEEKELEILQETNDIKGGSIIIEDVLVEL